MRTKEKSNKRGEAVKKAKLRREAIKDLNLRPNKAREVVGASKHYCALTEGE